MARPFSDNDRDCRVVDVQGLIDDLKGGSGFTFDQIVLQLSAADDAGEDFPLVLGNQRYRVPLGHIREFFERYEKPQRKMSPEQEVIFLRKKLDEQRGVIEKLTGIVKETPQGAMLKDILEGKGTPDDIRKTFDAHQLTQPTSGAEVVHKEPEPQEVPSVEPERESPNEIQERLKEEVKGKQPVDTREAAKGVDPGERSPSAPDDASL